MIDDEVIEIHTDEVIEILTNGNDDNYVDVVGGNGIIMKAVLKTLQKVLL